MILVTGATGTVGCNVVAQLVAAGVPVRALSRRPGAVVPGVGVEVVTGDLSRPESLVPALAGVDAVFLFPVDDTASDVARVLGLAGVRRVVVLSSAAVAWIDEAVGDPLAERHRRVERAVAETALEWTFVRPGVFAKNSLRWVPEIRQGGPVHLVYPDATASPIHEHDIAAVAVRALTEEGHGGAVYTVTGPESLTQAEQVHAIGDAVGRPVAVEAVTRESARDAMSVWPAQVVDSLLQMQAASVGRPAPVTDTVERVTGKPARTFREWAIDHAADFR